MSCWSSDRRARRLASALGAALLVLASGCATVRVAAPASAPTQWWAFTAPWDPRSNISVAAHASRFDAVVYGWIALDSATGTPRVLYRDTLATKEGAGTQRLAIITSYTGTRFHPELVAQLAESDTALGRVARAIAEQVASAGYRGAVLDLEGSRAPDSSSISRVVRAIADTMHAHGLAPVAIALPATDTVTYPARAFPTVDVLMPMLYDQHWAGGPPGPVADPAWVRRVLAMRVAERGANGRVVAAFPLYGYQWRTGQPTLAISFPDAQRIASQASVPLDRDSTTQTLHASLPGSWELWVTDATLLANLVEIAHDLGVSRIALWRLGLEDPVVWTGVVK